MSNEEKQVLFGEYATGNISQADKRRLMAAALEDQDLFDAIAEQEELSELTVTLPSNDSAHPSPGLHPTLPVYASRGGQSPQLASPAPASASAPMPPVRRNPWPFLFTGAAALALAVTGVFFLRTQTEQKTEVAQAPAPAITPQSEPLSNPAEEAPPITPPAAKPAAKPEATAVFRENKIVVPEAPAQPAARDQLAAAPPPPAENAPAAKTSPPKSTPAPSKQETEPVVVGSVTALPRFQIFRRSPGGEITPAAELQDGDTLVVRYVPTQSGLIDLRNLATNTTLATRNGTADQPVDLPLTAVRGTMNLELRLRPPVALAFAESRAAAPAASASGGAVRADTARAEVAKERKAAPAPPPPAVRIFLTVR